jgi:hypothetical protein
MRSPDQLAGVVAGRAPEFTEMVKGGVNLSSG